MKHIGYVYQYRKQYDKAVAWYLLAASENNPHAQCNIGILYDYGLGVPKNYLCALKWYLKAAEQNEYGKAPNSIGKLFENGYGVLQVTPLFLNQLLQILVPMKMIQTMISTMIRNVALNTVVVMAPQVKTEITRTILIMTVMLNH
jgi:tetratricopeptide (TPR) repeat protein